MSQCTFRPNKFCQALSLTDYAMKTSCADKLSYDTSEEVSSDELKTFPPRPGLIAPGYAKVYCSFLRQWRHLSLCLLLSERPIHLP